MTDRELLEWAARAEGVAYRVDTLRDGSGRFRFIAHGKEWNPLTDDGAALRLAVKLNMALVFSESGNCHAEGSDEEYACERMVDVNAAARRAIVRVAAEIGKAM